MPSVVAIHGTGVREAGYQQMLDVMTRRFQKQRPAYQITPCPWYKKHGVAAPPYKSVPLRKEFRAVGQNDESDEVLAWQGLIVDPLSELRNMTEDGEGFASPTAGAQLAANVRQVTRPEGLQAYEMVPFWEPARDLVLSDDATKDAIARGASQPDAILLIARALVAAVFQSAIEQGRVVPDGEVRDAWVDELRQSMGTDLTLEARAVPGFLKPLVRATNRFLVRPFGESHSPLAGDILLYQARGEGIRDYISDVIQNASAPVYVMAHSLGGIAAVDTLILKPELKVERLITFGSQAPFFFEIGALVSRRAGETLPDHFPQWLNICDPNDLLSFRAGEIFGGDQRITDRQIDSGQPPLAAHSSYLGSNAFWERVWPILP
jgi:hypothetical protein